MRTTSASRLLILLSACCALFEHNAALAQDAASLKATTSEASAKTVRTKEAPSAAKSISGVRGSSSPAARKLAADIVLALGGLENLKRFHVTAYKGAGKIEQVSTISGTSNMFDIEVFSRGVKQFCKIDLLGQPLVSGYDGDVSWTQQGDHVFPADPQTTKQLAEDIKHGTLLLLTLEHPETNVKIGTPRTVQGANCDALVVTADDGKATTFYADQKTHLVLRSEYKGLDLEQGIEAEKAYEYKDYRSIDGTQQAFDTLEFTGAKKHSRILFTNMEKLAVLDDSLFSMPEEKAIARLKEGPVTIPFEYVNNEILVKVKINNLYELRFILDTGATQSIIDEQAAKSFGAAQKSNLSMTTGSGSIKMSHMTLETMAFGDVVLSNIPVAVANLQGFSEIINQRPAGLIGANILRRFLVTIDYDERKIILADPKGATVPPNAFVLPTKPSLGTAGLAVNGTLDDKLKLTFLVDSGAAFNNVSETLVKPLMTTPPLPVGTLKGLDGFPVKIASIRFDSLDLGPVRVSNPIFSVAPPPSGKDPSGLIASGGIAILGNPLWSKFRLTVDYRNQRLVLEETPKRKAENKVAGEVEAITLNLRRSKKFDEAVVAYRQAADNTRKENLVDAESQCHMWAALALAEKLAATKIGALPTVTMAEITSEFNKAHTLAHDPNVRGRVLAYWGYVNIWQGKLPAEIRSGREMIARAITIAPSEPAVFAVTGYMLKKFNITMRSGLSVTTVADQALMLDPANWLALWTKYKLSVSQGKTDEAALVVLQLKKYYPGVPEVVALVAAKPGVVTAAGSKVEVKPPVQVPAKH